MLKQWIEETAEIPVGRQILMTAQGKNVKQQHLVRDSDIFVYDKRFLAGSAPDDVQNESVTPKVEEIPSELDSETNIDSWQKLFRARRAWAIDSLEIVKQTSEKTSDLASECEIIDRSAHTALDNLRNHISSLESLFEKTQEWARETIEEHAGMLRDWRSMSETLKELPIRDDIGQLMNASGSDTTVDVTGTMFTLLDAARLDVAEKTLQSASQTFVEQVGELNTTMVQLKATSEVVFKLVEVEWPAMNPASLIEEAETIFKKVDVDYSDALRAGSDTKAIAKVSRVAAGHTNSLLPSLKEVVTESLQVLETATAHKSTLVNILLRVLREISSVQSTLSALQGQLSKLALGEEGQTSLEVLDKVFRIPSVYGSILVEAVRRSEWNEKIGTDLVTFKDELSQYKDDEVRRRRKWTTAMAGFLNEESEAPSALSEFTFSTPANPWPFVSRQEIFTYVEDLRALQIDDAVEQLTQALRELDGPVKRRPHPKAFKNGSIHDAMQNSFMRGGDNARTLHDDKIRLEDKVRASESRIRKLEDLLHRQSQIRPQSNLFTPTGEYDRQPTSPGPDTSRRFEPSSRRSSVSVRRLSNHTPDEKAMVQKILSLENEIGKLREESHIEQRNMDHHRVELEQAQALKQDLMANFTSARQGWDDERQRIEDENHELKIRLEDMEEELRRVVGSRDYEKEKLDHSINNVRTELERLRKTSDDELSRLRIAKQELESQLSSQREKGSRVEMQLQRFGEERTALHDRNRSLANDFRSLESKQQDVIGTLQSVHEHLSPAGSAPEDLGRLARALEVLAEGAIIHTRGLDDQIRLLTAQTKADEDQIKSLETQLSRMEDLRTKQTTTLQDRDSSLREQRQMIDTLQAELATEKVQIEQLRAQSAAGETGSDALRNRLSEEEKKVEQLTISKDQSEVKNGGLQRDIDHLTTELESTKMVEHELRTRMQDRAQRARNLSERLVQHNDRMIRMLESFGYAVTRENEKLDVQRASKLNASQFVGTEPMKRQVSGSIPVHYSDPNDAQHMYWTTDDADEQARFDAFIATIVRLDIDDAVELLTKRYKDVETMAKRYQKDARTQREKTHRLSSEAHEKIAYRGFKEGDLALFLPTRNQATKPWAAFNVGAPHYFLKEQDSHRLQSRDWLLARINKIEERVVDLSRSMSAKADDASEDNPFELSDGLRWYLLDAAEEKPGAPSTPGLGKSTVAASVVDVKAQIGSKSVKDDRTPVNAAKTLHRSLDSRRSSEASRKSVPPLKPSGSALSNADEAVVPTIRPSDSDLRNQGQAREDAKLFDVVRQDLMLGP